MSDTKQWAAQLDTINELWNTAEQKLRALKVCGDVSTRGETEPHHVLHFRKNEKAWRICLSVDGSDPRPILECTMMHRIEAVRYLPLLERALLLRRKEIAGEIKQAIAPLETFVAETKLADPL